jgi:GntR family transcriptional regulator
MVSRAAGRPAYLQVADALREQIRDGTYPPGAQLPTERALMDTWRVSSKTIRAALDRLRAEGYIISRQGVGSFVRAPGALRRMSSDLTEQGGWIAACERLGLAPAVQTTVTTAPAPAHVAEELGIGAGDQVVIRARRMGVETDPPVPPSHLSTSHIPLSVVVRAPALQQVNPGPGGMLARLEEAGYGPLYFDEVVRARMPDPEEASALELVPGTPVLAIRQYTYSRDGEVLDYKELVIAGDREEYAYRYGTVPGDGGAVQ